MMWMFEYSECSYCQTKYRDFRNQDLGLEYRRVFVPVSERSSREAAALAKSRDARDYHLYMQGRKRAPAIDRDNEAIDLHNAIIKAASEDIPPILRRNGWSARGLVFPTYFWIEDGQLMANGGYLKDNFAGAVARAQSGWNDASRALTARLSSIQSAMDRMAASTRVSTNLRIRLIDPAWAGEPEAAAPAEAPRPTGPRL